MIRIKEKLSQVVGYSQELGLDLTKEEDRFKWFLASILFAKRISSQIAKRTYKEFEKEGLITPKALGGRSAPIYRSKGGDCHGMISKLSMRLNTKHKY